MPHSYIYATSFLVLPEVAHTTKKSNFKIYYIKSFMKYYRRYNWNICGMQLHGSEKKVPKKAIEKCRIGVIKRSQHALHTSLKCSNQSS